MVHEKGVGSRLAESTPDPFLLSEGYFVRGRVRLERGVEGALADLTKAVDLSQRKDADILHALADALHRSGRLPDALTTQRLAVKPKPKDKMAEQLAAYEKEAGATSSDSK